nr:MAG TPA: thymidylate kinase [Caudoviricetes sp.]
MIIHDYPGQFITIEGINGCGKSTLINDIKEFIKGKPYENKFVFTREFTDTSLGNIVREQMEHLTGLPYAYLVFADRYKHLEDVIIPALKEGKVVICDRYALSSFCYQYKDGVSMEKLMELSSDIIIPDFTIYLDASVNTISYRRRKRKKETGVEYDRYERDSIIDEYTYLINARSFLKQQGWSIIAHPNEDIRDQKGVLTLIMSLVKKDIIRNL